MRNPPFQTTVSDESFFSKCHLLNDKTQAEDGGLQTCVLLCMIFHAIYFSMGDLPCKSQSCAKLGKICANRNPWKMLSLVVSTIFCEY